MAAQAGILTGVLFAAASETPIIWARSKMASENYVFILFTVVFAYTAAVAAVGVWLLRRAKAGAGGNDTQVGSVYGPAGQREGEGEGEGGEGPSGLDEVPLISAGTGDLRRTRGVSHTSGSEESLLEALAAGGAALDGYGPPVALSTRLRSPDASASVELRRLRLVSDV